MVHGVRGFIKRHATLLRWAGVLAIVALGVALLQMVPVREWVLHLQGWVERLGPWGPVVFVLAFIGLTSLLLPGWPLNVLGGALFGPLAGGALTVLASALAAAVPFLISRYLARGFVERAVRRYPKFDAVYRALGEEANWKVVAAVRLSHALPYGLQNYLLGITPIRLAPYVITTVLITLPGIFMIAYLGHLGATALGPDETEGGWWRWIWRGGGVLVAGGAIFYLGRLVRRALTTRLPSTPDDDDAPGAEDRSPKESNELVEKA